MGDGWEPYWRDTILIQPGRSAPIAFVADPRTTCHRSGNLASGGVKRLTACEAARAKLAGKVAQDTAR
jgi:hypothetical protein